MAPGATPRPRLEAALDELGRREIQDLLLEGGPTLAGAFFDAGEIDEMRLFIAPVLLGAAEARAALEGEGAARIADGVRPLATELRAGRRGHAGPRPAAGVVSALMFTGIIKELGRVEAVEAAADGARLRIRAGARLRARPRATRSRSTASA